MYVCKKGKNIYKLQAEEIIKKFHGVPACFFFVYLNLICEKTHLRTYMYVHAMYACAYRRICVHYICICIYFYWLKRLNSPVLSIVFWKQTANIVTLRQTSRDCIPLIKSDKLKTELSNAQNTNNKKYRPWNQLDVVGGSNRCIIPHLWYCKTLNTSAFHM